jgi:hypothetical protein
VRLARSLLASAGAAALVAGLCACGGGTHAAQGGRARAARIVHQPAPARVAFGITEDNAQLLWPADPSPGPAGRFEAARRQLSALHPAYVRLLIDWSKLQPSPSSPPDLSAMRSGCAREVGPCGAYRGLEAELAAIAAQQRSGGGFRVLVDIYGTPAWAAAPVSGCESGSTPAYARPLAARALPDYELLVRSLLALGAGEGVALEWWSPWNEPNDPLFLSPQRGRCSPEGTPLAPETYAQLARALARALHTGAGGRAARIVLGELSDFTGETPHTLGIARFISALPADVLCLAGAWSLHEYAGYPPARPAPDGVHALEAALDARGVCARAAPIWVTETGAGSPEPGRARAASRQAQLAGCAALARRLAAWRADPRVDAVFQYTFREDPDFPVGLADASLTQLYSAYGLWRRYARARDSSAAALESACR